jgi:hypothetical protein
LNAEWLENHYEDFPKAKTPSTSSRPSSPTRVRPGAPAAAAAAAASATARVADAGAVNKPVYA